MKNSILLSHTQRVNKVLVVAMWTMVILSIVDNIYRKESVHTMIPLLALGAIASTVLVVLKKKEEVTAAIICYTFLICNVMDMFVFHASTSSMFSALLFNICFALLYMNKKFFIIFAAMVDIAYITGGIIRVDKFTPEFGEILSIVNICLVFLYFVAKWGSELIVSSANKEKEANDTVEALKQVMISIKENTASLNNSIKECDMSLGLIKEGSGQITAAMQEAAQTVMKQTESINRIFNKINDASEGIGKSVAVSNNMNEVSNKTRNIVSQGAENIEEMDRQMGIIHHAMQQSLSTVTDLEKSMNEVNGFLESITQIAKQTNLLALNASIEAARAGEQGKGFAVVADEVGKLAEQSTETVGLISSIIEEIQEKTNAAFSEVQQGNTAVQTGEAIVQKVNKSFAEIEDSFKEIDRCIEEELRIVDHSNELFNVIRREAEALADAAEHESAAAEEMLAALSEQNHNIGNIYGLMKDIRNSSENLEGITNREL